MRVRGNRSTQPPYSDRAGLETATRMRDGAAVKGE